MHDLPPPSTQGGNDSASTISIEPRQSVGERLTRGRVVTAAVTIARRDGLDALSMRRLAAELGVSTMAAYRHVPGKDSLVDDVVDAVIATIPLDGYVGTWSERLEELTITSYRTLDEFPGLPERIHGRALGRPGIIRWLEAFNTPLVEAGVPVEARSGGTTSLVWLLRGASRLTSEWGDMVGALEEIAGRDDEDGDDTPIMRQGRELLGDQQVEDLLRSGVRLILTGLRQAADEAAAG